MKICLWPGMPKCPVSLVPISSLENGCNPDLENLFRLDDGIKIKSRIQQKAIRSFLRLKLRPLNGRLLSKADSPVCFHPIDIPIP